MVALAMELLLDEELDDEVQPVPRLLPAGECTKFQVIYNSQNVALFRDYFRMNRSTFDQLFERCSPYIPATVRDQREALGVGNRLARERCIV
ncbi:hypothetical protein Ae201684P_019173 [Aphanomyces euteiches]|nr:hypothetical protein Ae201684P_019173 [Aphanomyces euteiches]